MSKFEKGKSGNPSGRPKGSKNKVNTELRDKLEELSDFIVDDLLENPNQILELKANEKIKALNMLSEYIQPKLSRSNNIIDIDNLTDEQIDRLFKRLGLNN